MQKFIRTFPYNLEKRGPSLRSAREAIRAGTMHCLESSFVAAAILENGGYPAVVMSLESADHLDHVMFLFQNDEGHWGAISRSHDEGLHGRAPVFRSLKSLALSYIDPYVDFTGKITGYGVANLNALGHNWRFSKKNIWKFERKLTDLRHHRISYSKRRHARLVARHRLGLDPIPQPSWW